MLSCQHSVINDFRKLSDLKCRKLLNSLKLKFAKTKKLLYSRSHFRRTFRKWNRTYFKFFSFQKNPKLIYENSSFPVHWGPQILKSLSKPSWDWAWGFYKYFLTWAKVCFPFPFQPLKISSFQNSQEVKKVHLKTLPFRKIICSLCKYKNGCDHKWVSDFQTWPSIIKFISQQRCKKLSCALETQKTWKSETRYFEHWGFFQCLSHLLKITYRFYRHMLRR